MIRKRKWKYFYRTKRKISSDINSSDFEFLSLQISKKKKKKNYEIFSLLLGRKNFQNFHAQKERERNVIIITSHKKEAKGKKREKREAKVRNASVIGLCIFHAETFRRRSPKQKEEEMKRERERERNKPGEKCVMDLGQEWSSWNQASRAKTANVPRKVASRR